MVAASHGIYDLLKLWQRDYVRGHRASDACFQDSVAWRICQVFSLKLMDLSPIALSLIMPKSGCDRCVLSGFCIYPR